MWRFGASGYGGYIFDQWSNVVYRNFDQWSNVACRPRHHAALAARLVKL